MTDTDLHRLRYEQWVRLYAPELYRYAYRLTGRRDVAEDLVQETFIEAWKSVARQKEPERARGWLFQILRHCHAHFVRDSRNHRLTARLTEQSNDLPPDPFRLPVDVLAQKDELQVALDSLSPPMRDAFLMVFGQGLTCRETAGALSIPLGTVLSRLDAARRSLRAALTDKIQPPPAHLPCGQPGQRQARRDQPGREVPTHYEQTPRTTSGSA